MNEPWYKNAVLYAVDIRMFQDSDGDGIGDLNGLTSHLDYLADLGVTCLWLLPFYPTPFRDNGYDIQDYYGVDSHVGSFDDFVRLRKQAEARGIKVIIDLVMNHTSDQHPWFLAAQRDPASRYHHYYVWSDKPHDVPKEQRTIFPGAEDDIWTYSEPARQYYYHRFYHFEPELNGRNPQVREELYRVLDFWLSFGVAGFRVDAASHLLENKGAGPDQETTRDYQFLDGMYQLVAQRRNDVFLMGEADVAPQELGNFFGQGDRLTLLLNFLLSEHIFLALATQSARPIEHLLQQFPDRPLQAQWVNFLRNLDELDLEQLSEEQQQKVLQAFAPEKNMQIYGRGLRRRVAPMLGGDDRKRIELAYSLLFAQPGIPVITYGDEIGIGDDLTQSQRDAVRPPMQWSDKQNADFSAAPSNSLLRQVIADGPFGYQQINVAAQQKDPGSLLHWMRQLIQVRKRCPEIGSGTLRLLDPGTEQILAQLYEHDNEALLMLHNLAEQTSTIQLSLTRYSSPEPVRILGTDELKRANDGNYHIALQPYSYCWFRFSRS